MKIVSIIAFVLTIIGAIVWGLIGLFDFNLVAMIFGTGALAIVPKIIYILVGLSGIWLIIYWAVCRPFKRID